MKTYQRDNLNNITFPLGGIGAGSIGLAGNGIPVDCEIMNRPNRESVFGYTHFAIKAEDDTQVMDYRVLAGDNTKDLMGTQFGNYGYGNAMGLSGVKHFGHVAFQGEFPVATVSFRDSAFPGMAKMEAFNPFIPSNEDDSSLPAAFFQIKIKNNTGRRLKYSVAFSVTNPFAEKGVSEVYTTEATTGIVLNSAVDEKSSVGFGNMTLATNRAGGVSYQQNWFRGEWQDMLTMFLNDFSAFGELKNRAYATADKGSPDTATLCCAAEIKPGCEETFFFVLSWYEPNYEAYWLDDKPLLKNYYSTVFGSSRDVSDYCFLNLKRLYSDTMLFKKALYSSTLPPVVLDAIQGNLAILKSTTCLRLENGDFWGWEGVSRTAGSCMGTCEHVWNYAYALAFLFPRLERSIRNYEFDHSLQKSGMMIFRTDITMSGRGWERACVDGQMGSVMKAYREWKLSGDDRWLKNHWPKIKLALGYAWSEANTDKWDLKKSGVITGRQHHTLDVELFGVHAWLTGFYHGALLAASKMAEAVGDVAAAEEYSALFQKGKSLLDKQTFNGKYYIQGFDIKNEKKLSEFSDDAHDKYWCEENKQMKYQIDHGCEIDQVVAGWHADLMGLGSIFVDGHRKKALQSIYQYNFKSMRDFSNVWRVFACNNEKGLVMCSYPKNVQKPKIPIPYTDECMTGFEYACACNMLQCGMEKEALEIVAAVRERYDGKKRNPWAELECGASYSRAMASYSFLLAYSGFQYDLSRGMIGFHPVRNGKYFWSVDGAWGTVTIKEHCTDLTVLYGSLKLKNLVVPYHTVNAVTMNGEKIAFSCDNESVYIDVLLEQKDALKVSCKQRHGK